MHALLAALARLTSHRPKAVLAVVLVVTIVLGGFAGNQQTDTDLTAFATDSELAAALDRVQDEFAAGGSSLQVVVDAGAGGDVLSREGVRAALEVEEAVAASGADLGRDDAVSSYGGAVMTVLGLQGVTDLADATEDQIDAAASLVLAEGAAQLVSNEVDLEGAVARAGLVVVTFPPTMADDRVADLSIELAERIDALDPAGVELSPFNAAVLGDALQAQSEEEMPRLLGLSMLLILGILLFQFRTVSDVVIGLVGLVVSITWMLGFGVLLGPDHLGVVGPFSQMAMIVPVLLVGLGVDYAIHLTSRYREEQSHGLSPARSAGMAVHTVGGALVLATVTTIVGFLTNLSSPLPPIADFGVLTAVGVAGAFIVMTTLVPAARNLLDSRKGRNGAQVRRPAAGLATVIGRTAVVARRAPKVALGAALAVSVAATVAATQVGTTFSQDDFIPADSEIGETLDRIETLFAGGLAEVTFVVLDGDLTDPAAADAQLEVQADLAGTPGVRTAAGAAQASSPAALVASLAAADPVFAAQADELGFGPDRGFDADADVAALYVLARSATPAETSQVIAEDGRSGVLTVATSAGQDGAGDLADELRRVVEPLEAAGVATVVTSEALVADESLVALTDSQTRGIAITLAAALALLVAYYGFKERKPLLGVITMIPSVAVVSWVLGTMWVLGISFNVLTAMVASLGIGIGVPFGIHVTHRFLEDRRRYDTIDDAILHTVTHTGGAMAGSAATTAAGFGVLVLASLAPMQQFGLIVAITIVYSFVAAIFVQPACLKLWGEHRARRGDVAVPHAHEQRREVTGSDEEADEDRPARVGQPA